MLSGIFLFLFYYIVLTRGRHFNGGTITWEAINPYSNSSPIAVRIIQTYSWTHPPIKCLTNVPDSSGFGNGDLICMAECTTDGGYSSKKIKILTDCQSVSVSLGLMTSQRAVTINLTANAHFYLANIGTAWAPLNFPAVHGLQWSIVTYIDLRIRPDGFINTPPTASVVSPQYAFVNQTIQIDIPISDANQGDELRCRWATYTPGNRRRRSDEEYQSHLNEQKSPLKEMILSRKTRQSCGDCGTTCKKGCSCSCPKCIGTTCKKKTCKVNGGCTAATTQPTTSETQGTTKSTSSFPNRQAIDECGGICHPSSVPNDTVLFNNCSISFRGLKAGTWYAIAIQVMLFVFTQIFRFFVLLNR